MAYDVDQNDDDDVDDDGCHGASAMPTGTITTTTVLTRMCSLSPLSTLSDDMKHDADTMLTGMAMMMAMVMAMVAAMGFLIAAKGP